MRRRSGGRPVAVGGGGARCTLHHYAPLPFMVDPDHRSRLPSTHHGRVVLAFCECGPVRERGVLRPVAVGGGGARCTLHHACILSTCTRVTPLPMPPPTSIGHSLSARRGVLRRNRAVGTEPAGQSARICSNLLESAEYSSGFRLTPLTLRSRQPPKRFPERL